MIDLKALQNFFPVPLRGNPLYLEYMVKEYLQYQMLDIIYNSDHRDQFSFIGGTCIRIIHGIARFSEDLDFDVVNGDRDQFNQLTDLVIRKLRDLGFPAQADDKVKDGKLKAFRRNISFPGFMYNLGLSQHREKRFLIKMEAQAHRFTYAPEKKIIQKFNVFTQINIVPVDILLSMKIAAMLERQKGRDYYDCIFLMGRTRPNMAYLRQKMGIATPTVLKKRILASLKGLDLNRKKSDFKHLIFNQDEVEKVGLFPSFVKGYKF